MCKLFKKRKEQRVLKNITETIETKQVYPSVKAKVEELEVPTDNPFANDKLERKKNAEVLTSAACAYQGGAVLALNGAWGTGKTTFVRMWAQHLKNNGFPVIYYNAWEDDISDEPLFSLLRGLKSANKDEKKEAEKKEKLHNVFTVGSKLIVGIAAGAIKGFIERYGKALEEAVKGGVETFEKEIMDSLEKEDETAEVMEQFHKELSEYVAFVCDQGKPLIYFIDELDRCNPSFAVKVLERIKHLFDVPNVVFVLSIDKQQLAYSINGFYGSENINSMEYLRRFIDIDYNLPSPEPSLYCDYLFDLYGLGNCITKAQDTLDFKQAVGYVVGLKNLNLRQIERIYALQRIAYCSMKTANFYDVSVFFFLSYLKVCEPEFYRQIESYSFTIQQFVDELENFTVKDITDKSSIHLETRYLGMMASLICCYYGGLQEKHSFIKDRIGGSLYSDDGKLNLMFKHFDVETMKTCISGYHVPGSHRSIEFFADKLDLLSNFNTN